MDNEKNVEISGVFNKTALSSCGIMLMVLGAFIAIVFDTMYEKNAGFSEKVFVLTFCFVGIFLFISGIVLLIFNKKSYFQIRENEISARYPVFGKLKCMISDISFIQSEAYILTVILKSGKAYKISGLINANEIRKFIASKIEITETVETKEELTEYLTSGMKKYRKYVKAMLVMIFASFVLIGITAFLTGAMEISEFGMKENIIFAVFVVIMICNFIGLFIITGKTTKLHTFIPEKSEKLRKILVTTSPLPSGNPVKVYTDDNYFGRITVFSMPGEESVYYVAEFIDEEFKLVKKYESEIFESIDKISDITENFNEVEMRL